MYILFDPNTNDYVCRASNGGYNICKGISQSALFSTEKGALNILNNGGIPKLIASKHTFKPTRVTTKSGKAYKIINPAEPAPVKAFDFSAPEEIRKAADYLGRVMEDAAGLSLSIANMDREISDIQHYIETKPLNAAQRSHIFKIYREKLAERRLYKNLQDITSTMENAHISEKNLKNIVYSVDGLDTKAYSPRSAFGEILFGVKKVEE